MLLLDGTWSQAKALWWRNPWMLKCQRVILNPSRYGRLRREPRKDGLSTIEAAATLLSGLERRPDIAETLNASFGYCPESFALLIRRRLRFQRVVADRAVACSCSIWSTTPFRQCAAAGPPPN
ncbi:DTW domain-containing protein YfiP [Bradyrhizobium diazoefficiens]|uniref:tRNA-uridine aminocarboxypropyltransferase n=1 Tax=Bradyrhizobium diazoefficiens TaxID=1355477 RepID=A0A0E4FZR5_9BRAD|nr:DTW [Bradyrhizobium diazoefficiens]